MIMIAHRGNLIGPNAELENNPQYIKDALDKGFHVEIDVWCKEGKIFLGHDRPTYEVSEYFLVNDRFFCHAKNWEALEYFSTRKDIHWFWHENDLCTLTSQGMIWLFPDYFLNGGILNQPEYPDRFDIRSAISSYEYSTSVYKFAGVCSDYVQLFRDSDKL